MKILNLIREFELQKMKDSETVGSILTNCRSLAKLLNALQAQEQRRLMRSEGSIVECLK